MIAQLMAWYTPRRYRILFATLLATLALGPLRSALDLPLSLLKMFVGFNLVVAAAGITERHGRRMVLIAVAAGAVVVSALTSVPFPVPVERAGDLLLALVAVLAAVAAVRYALRATQVDAEHVAAALSAYLVAGLLFALLYVLVDNMWPGSVVDPAATGSGSLSLESAIYYSYVTLATLGYGDIVPRGVARGLAVVEALSANLYLTVLVARLVGLYAQQSGRRPPRSGDPAT